MAGSERYEEIFGCHPKGQGKLGVLSCSGGRGNLSVKTLPWAAQGRVTEANTGWEKIIIPFVG